MTLADAMRLAWVVRSFNVKYINIPERVVSMYEFVFPGYEPIEYWPPPNDEKFLVSCGFDALESRIADPSVNIWGETIVDIGEITSRFSFSIDSPRTWNADGYPPITAQNPDFDPARDLVVYPTISLLFNSPAGSGKTYSSQTVDQVSQLNAPKVSGLIFPKSAGFSKDYYIDYYTTGAPSLAVVAPPPEFTFNNFWEYRDENGENPIWNKTTGARL